MSAETSQWLNTRTLIGFTDKRGNAWHYRKEDQGGETNHYPQAVPVDDVLRRLFDFEVVPVPVVYKVPCTLDDPFIGIDDDGTPYRLVESTSKRVGWLTNDTFDDLGVFSAGYQGHQYKNWLLNNVASILDDDLGIGSAGLLANRARAWVSVEVPENIVTPEGVVFRPHLLAATSFDGSLSTTYKRVATNVVCDNTMAQGLSEKGQQIKVRHSRNSDLKLADAREALAIVHTIADDFAAEVKRLCEWEVSDRQFASHLDLMVPLPDQAGRALTMAESKQGRIAHLYHSDDRAAPWKGTAWGVLQAHNTYAQHYATVRNADAHNGVGRGIRNMENAISGKTATADAEMVRKLHFVTSRG